METVPETTTYAKKISVEEYNQQKDNYTQKALKELNEQMKTFRKPESNPRTLITSNKKLSISLPNSDNDDNDDNNDANDDNCDEYNSKNHNSDSDYEDKKETIDTTKSNSSLNFIIKHYVNDQTPQQQQLLKKRKITNTNKHDNQSANQSIIHNQTVQKTNTMSDAIYAQHELDMDVITNLKLKNNNLKNENEDLDTKKHFLTLELSNAQCEIIDLKKQISDLKDVNIKLKQYINFTKKQDDLFVYYLKLSCYIIVLLMIFLIYMSL
jgi:hypothetical protein